MPPGIANVSKDQVICEGSLVTLSCNATGRPTPTITWTKVEDNGTDSAPLLPVLDGKHVLSNIQQSANGTYRCTADNRVGVPANRTASVKVECKSSFLYSCDFNFQTSWCCIGNTSVYDVSYCHILLSPHTIFTFTTTALKTQCERISIACFCNVWDIL